VGGLNWGHEGLPDKLKQPLCAGLRMIEFFASNGCKKMPDSKTIMDAQLPPHTKALIGRITLDLFDKSCAITSVVVKGLRLTKYFGRGYGLAERWVTRENLCPKVLLKALLKALLKVLALKKINTLTQD
jgi:hypothetical protein